MNGFVGFLMPHSVEIASLIVATCALVVTYLAIANQHKPQILIYYRPNIHQQSIIDLVVENIGSGFTYDINFDQPLRCGLYGIETPEEDGQNRIAFENGIPFLSAGQSLSVFGGQFGGIQNWVEDGKTIKVTAYYKNPFSFSRKIEFVCNLQINHLKWLPTRKSADQAIVDSLKNSSSSVFYRIAKELEKANKLHENNQKKGRDSLDDEEP